MTRHSTRGVLPLLAAASLLLTACSDGTQGATQEESSSTASPSTASSGATDGSTTTTPPASPPELGTMAEGTRLQPASYTLTAWGGSSATKRAVVEAPDGYYPFGDSTFITPADGAPPFLALSYITAEAVYRNPCGRPGHSKDGLLEDPGPTVEDLADALAAQKLTTTTRPVPVTIDGYDGLYLELATSEKTDFSQCGDGVLDIFAAPAGHGGIYAEQPGQHYGIWILDLDGDREVISWSAYPGAPDDEIQTLEAMAESVHFVDPS